MNKKRLGIVIGIVAGLMLASVVGVGLIHWNRFRLKPACDGITHVDVDDNGLCDGCGADLLLAVDVYALNDLHGRFLDDSSQPGIDELTTYLQEHCADGVLLSSGDMWQGSSESNLSGGNLITEWMNEMDFVSMTLGNHEFDWGTEKIEENAELAEFPILAINVYDRATGARLPYCQPSVTVEQNGITIGIIGAVGDVYSSIASYMVEDVYFLTGKDLTKLVQEEATRLRNEGADIVILSVHDGHGSYDETLSDYVDIVFEGHTHSHYVLKDGKGVYHLQGGGENEGIVHAEMKVNSVTGTVSVTVAQYIPSSVYARAASSPLRDELYEKYSDTVSRGRDVLGATEAGLEADFLKQTVADLYREAGEAFWPECDIVLGGGYITVRSPYRLEAGEIAYSDLQMIFPFDNRLVLCKIKGCDLRSQFLETKNNNYFISLTEYGQAAVASLDDNAEYFIVIDRYSSQYGPNKCTEVEFYTDGIYARDLLANYISTNFPVR